MFVALGIQHVMRIIPIICHVTCSDLQYFSTLPHKRHDFRKKKSIDHESPGAGKSLARPTSQCILFDRENISLDAILVIYVYVYVYIYIYSFRIIFKTHWLLIPLQECL